MGVKDPKTTYNNEELASGIQHYIVKYIQNLDQVLANLNRVKVTISRAKSQFCRAIIKIIGYICDINSRHPDTSKVLKVLEVRVYRYKFNLSIFRSLYLLLDLD